MRNPLPPELRWLFAQVKPFLPWQALSLLCFSAASLLALSQPLLIKWLIDQVLPQRQAIPLLACTVLLFVAYEGRTLCTSLGTYLTLFSTQRAALNLRMRLLKHLNTLGADYHDTAPLGSRLYPFCEPVDEIAYFGSDLFPSILRTLFATLLTFCAMLALNPRMTIAIAPIIPVFLVARYYFRRRLERDAETVQTQRTLLNGFLQEHLAAVVQVQLLRCEQRQERVAFHFLATTFRCQQKLSMTGVLFSASTNLAIAIAAAAVLGTGGWSVSKGTLTIGSFIAFYSYVTQLFEPLSGAMDMYGMALRTFSSIRQVQRAFSLEPSIKDRAKAILVPDSVPLRLEFERVRFGYAGQKSTIHIASLEIPACQHVAVVGRNGAGKSTFARLAARLYDPTCGSVRVSGFDMRDLQLESLRAKVCYLPQTPTLFDDSFVRNLQFGKPGASAAELSDLTKIVGLDELLENMPERWNERIGPSGSRLSGGERQRLALARTLLQRPRILILDEATSALDPAAEHAILRKIPLVLPHTTLIFLSHRLHSLTWVDRILVFEAGSIVQDGPHEVLRKQTGLYSHLFRASKSSHSVCS